MSSIIDLTTQSNQVLTILGNGGMQVPVGTSGTRPANAQPGTIRWNMSSRKENTVFVPNLEVFNGTTWTAFSSENWVNTNFLNLNGSSPMKAALNMGGFRINNLREPAADNDAATMRWSVNRFVDAAGDQMTGPLVFGPLGIIRGLKEPFFNDEPVTFKFLKDNYLHLDSSHETAGAMRGNLRMANFRITNLRNPVDPQDAMTRAFADIEYVKITGGMPVKGDIVIIREVGSSPNKIEFTDLANANTKASIGFVPSSPDLGITTPNLIIDSKGAIRVPTGTTSERPSPAQAGFLRFNTTAGDELFGNRLEYNNGTDWHPIANQPDLVALRQLVEALDASTVGALHQFPMDLTPANETYLITVKKMLPLDGRTVLRADYPRLAAFAQDSGLIAVSDALKGRGEFGPGDGATTLTLPDYRAAFARGWGHFNPASPWANRKPGSLQSQEVQTHSHTGTFAGDPVPDHTHNIPSSSMGNGGGPSQGSTVTNVVYSDTQTRPAGAHTPSGTITIADRVGEETRPENIAVLWCIKY